MSKKRSRAAGGAAAFEKILVANRGEIACRVIRTARRMGIATVAVYSDADRRATHVADADEAVRIGPPPAAQSYIDVERVMEAVRATGASAVHPGYGFLSENPAFAAALEAEGVAFIGPSRKAIEAMGDKITSKKIAQEAGVSVVPGYMGLVETADDAVRIASEIGYPAMIKASAGGGGKGMRVVRSDAEVRESFESSRNEAAGSFGDDRMFVEKFVERPRHIEIQVLCDAHGGGVHLGERECSIQRRNQKVVEESPSPFLDEATRAAMGAEALALARAVGYASAGTVEFIVDSEGAFYFLEMNTRLQVEHPVTELVTGVDIVEEMIRVAAGAPLSISQEQVRQSGWAIESRIYAEDPLRGFLPSTGRLTRYRPPAERAAGPLHESGRWQGEAPPGDTAVRNDTGVEEGGEISIHYDPMIAKLCTWAPDRAAAVEAMRSALDVFELEGIGNNLPFLSAVMDHPKFAAGDVTTAFIEEEYPDGFAGVEPDESALRRIVAVCAAMNRVSAIRRARLSGRMDNHEHRIGDAWVVRFAGRSFDVEVAAGKEGSDVSFADGGAHRVSSAWRPGMPLAEVEVDGAPLALKVARIPGGMRVRHRGAALDVQVYTPRQAELASLIPEREPPDMSKTLLCPMPGLVVGIAVAEGEEVHEGQALCTLEAMKMENVLRAERRAVVSRIAVAVGDSLAVDQTIMEFE